MKLSPIQRKIAWAVGLTAGASAVVTAVAVATRKKPTGTTVENASAYAPYAPKGGTSVFSPVLAAKEKLALQQKFANDYMQRMIALQSAIAFKSAVVVDEATFRTIFTHGGASILTIPNIFYTSGHYSLDELGNHAHCQTFAASIGNAAYNFKYPYYNPGCIEYPSSDPRWQECTDARFEVVVQRALNKASLAELARAAIAAGIPGIGAPSGEAMYLIEVPASTVALLQRFAGDMLAQGGKTLPTTDDNGNPLQEPYLSLIQASIGAGVTVGLINKLSSHSAADNPCIRELDFGMIFQMFSATIGVVIGLAIGPALSGIASIVRIVDTVNKLSNLSK